ncbi:C_GCAxxG_C_C family protein [Marinifilum sp. JC120]|nr:C_GCAxxG_C_C family protein [Marinifilum sp. JC120]
MNQNLALKNLNKGMSCSEAVLASFNSQLNISEEDCIRLSSGLAGGIGFSGQTCGVVVAGIIVLGLVLGPASPEETKARIRVLAASDEFINWFADSHGSLDCKLLCEGADLPPHERAYLLREKRTPENYVLSTVSKIQKMINES